MKRPLVSVALFYVAGLLLGEHLQGPTGSLAGVALALAATAICLAWARHWLIWLLLIAAGWANMTCRTAILSPRDLRVTQGETTQLAVLRGTLVSTPSPRVLVRDEQEVWRFLAELKVTRLSERGANWLPARGTVLITTPGLPPPGLFGGQTVEVSGVLAPPPGPIAPGLFDYRTWLRRQGIYYQIKAGSSNDWQMLQPRQSPPLGDRFLAWAQATLARGLPGEDDSLRLLWAMTLGWKTGIANDVYEPFMQTGTMHVFAISGLHIALISGILVSLLRAFRVSRGWCGLIIIPLIWFYTAATAWQPSAVRSTLMMSLVIGGWALKRPGDLLNSLAAAAFLILLWEPRQLFGASFQLSFFVVLSIALLAPLLERLPLRWPWKEPLRPASLAPAWERWVEHPLRWLMGSLIISIASCVGSLPLTAYYFHLASPASFLANLVVVPLSSAALACNVGSLLCGAWFPWLSELFNFSAWFWMKLMIGICHRACSVPLFYSYVRGPSIFDAAIYYVLVIALLSGVLLAPRARKWGLAVLGALVLYYSAHWAFEQGRETVTVLPLQGGAGIFCRAPARGPDLLIDPGNSNCVELVTKPFLRAQGVDRLPGLLLTHGDLRHAGGAAIVTTLFSPSQIHVSPLRFRSPVYRRTIATLEQQPGRLHRLRRFGSLGPWTVLHPDGDERFARADDGALVLRGQFHQSRILLLPDLGRNGQDALLESVPDLHADIVVAGLPAIGEPLNDALLDAIQPSVIIVADSETPASARAPAQLRQRLAGRNIRVIYTRFAGAATIEFGKNGWQIRCQDGQTVTGGGGM